MAGSAEICELVEIQVTPHGEGPWTNPGDVSSVKFLRDLSQVVLCVGAVTSSHPWCPSQVKLGLVSAAGGDGLELHKVRRKVEQMFTTRLLSESGESTLELAAMYFYE